MKYICTPTKINNLIKMQMNEKMYTYIMTYLGIFESRI